ncbi:MAG: outer membrane protein assembly factor BamA [Hyphomicrobiales bacterium]|nr:outer membrane protein assembly factor BamA [Hyphomicrobiales bacterium]
MKLSRWLTRRLGVFRLVAAVALGVGGVASLPAPTALAQSGVTSVVVQGNQRVEADTIRSYFRPGPGGRLDPFQIDEGVKALYATGLFRDVQPSVQGGRLIITVVENPVINRIAFEGNKKVKDEQLKAEIQSRERGTLSRPVVQGDVARLVEVYRRSGRFDIRIEPKFIELPNNRVDLVFEISEGGKTGVKKIEFMGNRAYSDFRLKDVIKTSETGLLAFMQTADIYDPDRIEADRELLRRFYLKHGYIDVRIVSALGEFDPTRNGFVITFTIEEGEQFKIGAVDVQSTVRTIDPAMLRPRVRTYAGDVYNAEAVEKSVEDMTIEAAKRGFAFASVRPRAVRDNPARLVNIVFTIEEGQRAYIERINVRGNTRTRDYVIRREFDISEGDAYNRALVNRAERRLKNLAYFKSVRIATEPGSAPDRVVLNVDVEEQSTGEFSVSGGYSTADGFLAEVSIAERNLLGRGLYGKASVQYGQITRGAQVSLVDPYFLGYRVALGLDLFAKEQRPTSYVSYSTKTFGGGARLGFQLREDIGLQVRYSLYRQEVSLPFNLQNCNNINPNSALGTYPTPPFLNLPDPGNGNLPFTVNCYADGEASLAVKRELAGGAIFTSLVGYTLSHNSLDNNRSPTKGWLAEFRQDFAGLGGDVNFVRTSSDVWGYHEVVPDVVAALHLQGGYIAGWGSKDLRMLDHFQMGPNLVRGFAPAGIGPRDLTQHPWTGINGDALGGTMYWGASLEFQTPLYFLPKDAGVKVAAFADAGSLWNYTGPVTFPATGEVISGNYCQSWAPGANPLAPCPIDNAMHIRSSVGLGLLWDSPFGPLRFDYSFPLTKEPYDRVQQFRFGGGTKF